MTHAYDSDKLEFFVKFESCTIALEPPKEPSKRARANKHDEDRRFALTFDDYENPPVTYHLSHDELHALAVLITGATN